MVPSDPCPSCSYVNEVWHTETDQPGVRPAWRGNGGGAALVSDIRRLSVETLTDVRQRQSILDPVRSLISSNELSRVCWLDWGGHLKHAAEWAA